MGTSATPSPEAPNNTSAPAGTTEAPPAAATPPATPAPETAAAPAAPAPQPPAVPEKYEFKVPEGTVVDENLMKAFEPMARELGLTNEKAQKFIDMYADHTKTVVAAQEKLLEEQRAKWRETVKAQRGHEEMTAAAVKALDHFAKNNPELNDLFKGSWLGDHPAVVKFLADAGKLLQEHRLIDGRAVESGSGGSLAANMYPSMANK